MDHPPVTAILPALWIDQNCIARFADNVNLSSGYGICGGIEEVDFSTLDNIDNITPGDRLKACHIKVLAEGRLVGKDCAGCAGVEDGKAPANGVCGCAGIDSARGGADINPIVGQGHVLVLAIGNWNGCAGGERTGIND